MFVVEHITSRTVRGYLQNGSKKAQRWVHGSSIATVLLLYRPPPNKNVTSGMTPAEIMFSRKIDRSLISRYPMKKMSNIQYKKKKKTRTGNKFYEMGKKIFGRMYQTRKSYWDVGTIVKRISRMIYVVKVQKVVHKRNLNQTKSWRIDEVNDTQWMLSLWNFFSILLMYPFLGKILRQK